MPIELDSFARRLDIAIRRDWCGQPARTEAPFELEIRAGHDYFFLVWLLERLRLPELDEELLLLELELRLLLCDPLEDLLRDEPRLEPRFVVRELLRVPLDELPPSGSWASAV
jgi:hypothetical protein